MTHKKALKLARQLLWRYRHETPIVRQPHMICQEVDEAFERIDEALAQPEAYSNYCLQCEALSRELAALKAQQSNEQVELVSLSIDDKNINTLQVQSIQRVIARSKHAHMIDIKLRINGQDEWYEADWIKHITQTTELKCDGDFPEGFDSSCGLPAQALRTANAIMFDVIGKREWDVPCTAQHIISFLAKHTHPPVPTAQPEHKKYCTVCQGRGQVDTGIMESPVTVCNACNGTGLKAQPKEPDLGGVSVFHPQEPEHEPVAKAWSEGYRQGIEDERTSEENIGIAGFGAKVEPNRENPYTHPPVPTAQTDRK